MTPTQKKIRNNFWGQYGFPSYADNDELSEEVRLEILMRLGYVNTETIEFNSWMGIRNDDNSDYVGLAPCSLVFDYKPFLLETGDLKVELRSVPLAENKFGCEIQAIKGLRDRKFMPYPDAKTSESWDALYEMLAEELREIELALTQESWFFVPPTTGVELFQWDSDRLDWYFGDRIVTFNEIRFGWRGSLWGRFWYFIEGDRSFNKR